VAHDFSLNVLPCDIIEQNRLRQSPRQCIGRAPVDAVKPLSILVDVAPGECATSSNAMTLLIASPW
jgi:hypothetical protein